MFTRTAFRMRLLSGASTALVPVALFALSACGGDDDDVTGTGDTPTPEPTAPATEPPEVTPTLEPGTPTPAVFPIEQTYYLTMQPFVWVAYEPPMEGYSTVTWGGEVTFSSDGSTAEGTNHWYLWLEESDPSTDEPDCVMPETYTGDRAAAVDGKADDCFATYSLAIQPIQAETTCPQALVEDWNGAENPYGEWYSDFSFWDVEKNGYPSDYSEYADTLDGWGTRFIIFSYWIDPRKPTADQLVMPPCTETLTTNCYPVD